MLSKTLLAAGLLIASGSAMANDGYVYGRVITVEPRITINLGGARHYEGFRVLYETDGERYWTHSHTRPRNVIYVPRPVNVQPVYYSNHARRNEGGHYGWHNRDDHRSEWRGHDRHDNGGHNRNRGHDRKHHRDDD